MKNKKQAGTQVARGKGRPTDYTPELGIKICERIAQGESVRSIGRDQAMPDAATIFRWALVNEDFREHYTRAKEIGAEVEAEQIVEEADNAIKVVKGKDKSDNARVQAVKLAVDTRRWILAKKLPKKWGDRQVVTTEDKDGNQMPIQGNVITFASQNENGNNSQSDSK